MLVGELELSGVEERHIFIVWYGTLGRADTVYSDEDCALRASYVGDLVLTV